MEQTEFTYEQLSLKITNETEKVFVVSGKSFQKTGFLNRLIGVDTSRFVRFSDFSENPYMEEVIQGASLFNESDSNIILAVGGGTAIDLAKLIKYYVDSDLTGSEIEPPKACARNCELIVVPTTFGTGSESTHFAVVYMNGKKFSVADDSILPNSYLLDATLSESLPKHVKSSACLDALCQAIESYWSVAATAESKRYAIKAIKAIREHYETYITKRVTNSDVARNIAIAANLAGKAINITKTTAPHAISYTMTSKFGVPHGHAVTLCLRNMFSVNIKKSKDMGMNMTHCEIFKALGVTNVLESKDLLNKFMEIGGLETSLNKLGIKSELDLAVIVDNVNVERLGNHPVVLNKQDLLEVLS